LPYETQGRPVAMHQVTCLSTLCVVFPLHDMVMTQDTHAPCPGCWLVAADGLAAAQQQLAASWDCYQTYWLEGLPTSVEGLSAVVAAGVPVRAVLVVTPPAPATDGAGPPAAAEGAAEGSPDPAFADPLALAAAAAEWGSPLAGVAVLVVGQGTPSSCLVTGVTSPPTSSSSILSSPAWIATLAAEAAAAKAAADAAAADKAGAKGAAGKAPAGKGGKGAPASDAALLELSGLQEVARALATAPSVAKLYDEWKAAATVYQLADLDVPLGAGEQQGAVGGRETALYRHLLSTVEPERQSVPVLLHAMLEQVGCGCLQLLSCACSQGTGCTVELVHRSIPACTSPCPGSCACKGSRHPPAGTLPQEPTHAVVAGCVVCRCAATCKERTAWQRQIQASPWLRQRLP
jgi:hypothetical protein